MNQPFCLPGICSAETSRSSDPPGQASWDGGGSGSARLAHGWVIPPHKMLNTFAWDQF